MITKNNSKLTKLTINDTVILICARELTVGHCLAHDIVSEITESRRRRSRSWQVLCIVSLTLWV